MPHFFPIGMPFSSLLGANLVRCAPSLPPTVPSFQHYDMTKGTGGWQTDYSSFLGIRDQDRVSWADLIDAEDVE